MKKSNPITIRLDKNLELFLRNEAEKDIRSLSNFIEKILTQYQKQSQKGDINAGNRLH